MTHSNNKPYSTASSGCDAPTLEELEQDQLEMRMNSDDPDEALGARKAEAKKDMEKNWKANIMQLNHSFSFGKHRGIELREVMERNPGYIRWALEKDVIILSEEAEDFAIELGII